MTPSTLRSGAAAAATLCLTILPAGCREQSAAATSSFTFEVAPRPTQELSPEIGRLVPASAAGIVQVPRPADLRQELQRVTRAIAPGIEKLVDVVEMVSKLGLRPRDLDLTRAGAAILDMQMGPIFVLPMQDAQDASDLVDAESAVSGGYLGIAPGLPQPPAIGRRTPEFAAAMPDGDLALRLDLLKALVPFRPWIQKVLNPEYLAQQQTGAGAPDPTALRSIGIMLDGFKGMLATARILDVGVRLQRGALDLDVIVRVAKGSSWDLREARPNAELVHLARTLTLEDASLVFLSTPVWSKWMDAYQPFYQDLANSMAPGQGRAFADMMNRTRAMYGMIEVGLVSALRFGTDGLHGTMLAAASDPQALVDGVVSQLDQYNRLIDAKNPAAKPIAGTEKQVIAGVEFTSVAMRMDATAAPTTASSPALPANTKQAIEAVQAAIFGTEPLRVQLGTHGKHVLGTTGVAKTAAAALVKGVRDGTRPRITLLETVLAKLHATPEFLLACDVRATMKGIRAGMPEQARQSLKPVPPGDPILIWIAFSSAGTRYQMQLHVDLLPLIDLVRSLN